MADDLEDLPVSRDEARKLIDRFSGRIGLQWYISLLVLAAAGFCITSLVLSPSPVSFGDYLAFSAMIVFIFLCLSMLIIVHSKRVSFDGGGVQLGWFWSDDRQYDWDEVVSLPHVPFVPGTAVLKLGDGSYWPIFMELEKAQQLQKAIQVWKAAV